MQPLFAAIDSAAMGLSPAACRSLEFLRDILPGVAPFSLELLRSGRRPTLIWSDGAYEDAVGTVGFLAARFREGAPPPPSAAHKSDSVCMLWAAEAYEWCHGGAATVPADLMAALLHRKQQIGQVEIIGGMCAYLSLPASWIAGREVIHWIDNTSACATMCKGYSGVPDSARLVHAFHALCLGLQVRVWFEYVPTGANPGDEPSRRAGLAACVWRRNDGVISQSVPVLFPDAAALHEAAAWQRAGAAAQARF